MNESTNSSQTDVCTDDTSEFSQPPKKKQRLSAESSKTSMSTNARLVGQLIFREFKEVVVTDSIVTKLVCWHTIPKFNPQKTNGVLPLADCPQFRTPRKRWAHKMAC